MPIKSRLIIEGDVVAREVDDDRGNGNRVISTVRVRLQDWLDQIKLQEGTLEFLPPISCGHIIARQTKGNKSCVVVQLPPAVRSFMYTDDSRLYTVAFPYSIIAVQFVGQAIDSGSRSSTNIYWYYRNEPITSLDDECFFPNMPNVYENGRVCWSSDAIGLDLPLNRKIELVVANLFASNFNHHEKECHWQPSTKIEGHPQSFTDWETRSRENPNFILQLAWRPANITVRQVLERGVK